MTFIMWAQVGIGFTGALTLLFLYRWIHRRFGTLPSVSLHFSPKGGCTEAVVAELRKARREILMQAYSFSSKPIAQALVDAKTRGVKIEILFDRSQETETYSDLALLQEQGLAPMVDAQHAIAHNKIILIDSRTIITGSFNFTHQAEAENAENLLIMKGHPDLMTLYKKNFAVHKEHSQAPGAVKPAAEHRKAA
jgi:phosphatidylserine/phosphatidylglycerophosphate/cardiolipin synthase-like enzyme